MKFWRFLIILVIFAVLSWGVYNLIIERKSLEAEISKLSLTVFSLREENKSLTENIEYFKRPENLIKELKSQFNYKEAGENLIIIVPNATGGFTTSPVP
ncbi:MAG: septum formation initiator family protein [Patescibacteria group bacterium]|nr:septum formation initiator family protein [Patescibacteria group bacterium]